MGSVTLAEKSLHDFIMRTDRKSLYTQIKSLVTKAEQIAEDELNVRRQKMKELLETEDRIYEQEFANKVKSRIDEDIKARMDVLVKTRDEAALAATEFLEAKRVQQHINNCQEIREAIRQREIRNMKETQLEQIVERERKVAREREQDKYWLQVTKTFWELEDAKQKTENCLKEKVKQQTKETLAEQIKYLEFQRELERKEKVKDAEVINATMREIRLEEANRPKSSSTQQMMEYRKDLLEMMQKKKEREQAQAEKDKAEHIRIRRELQQIEAEKNAKALAQKLALQKATMEYIQYVRQMRCFGKEQEMMRNAHFDDLRRVDICTKGNIQAERERKAKAAKECYKELKQQICYQLMRRWKEDNERRNYKMTENPFARVNITRAEVLAQQKENRMELDKQLEVMNKIRAEQEAQYESELMRATYDEAFCIELAEKYVAEGMDYLPSHPNWTFIQSCVDKNKVIRLQGVTTAETPPRMAKSNIDCPPGYVDCHEIGQGDRCIKDCGRCYTRRRLH